MKGPDRIEGATGPKGDHRTPRGLAFDGRQAKILPLWMKQGAASAHEIGKFVIWDSPHEFDIWRGWASQMRPRRTVAGDDQAASRSTEGIED